MKRQAPRNSRTKTIAVLASGGVDSACLLMWAARGNATRVQPVYVSFGLLWESGELRALRKFLRAVRCAKCLAPVILRAPAADIYRGHWSLTGKRVPGARSRDKEVYLPGRNLLLLSKAAVYCAGHNIRTIAIGTLAANPFADAAPEFFSAFSKLAKAALGRPINIIAPFRRLTKNVLLKRYRNLPLRLCFSCLNPKADGRACGKCNKCAEWKNAALTAVGV